MAADDKTNPVPSRLREAMQRAGMSQKALGISAGIDASVASSRVNHYVTGRHVPHFALLARMAVVLKVPVAYFYTSDDALARLLANYPQLSVKSRRELVRLSEQLTAKPAG